MKGRGVACQQRYERLLPALPLLANQLWVKQTAHEGIAFHRVLEA